jgi:hypothetical protein
VGDPVQINGKTPGGVTGRGFVPGRSGNAGGRPRGLARLTRELVGDDGEKIVNFWLEVMEDPTWRGSERLRASELLAERGWGKAPQFAPLPDDDPIEREKELDDAVQFFYAEVARLAGAAEVQEGGPQSHASE